jgi:hypothetical protein
VHRAGIAVILSYLRIYDLGRGHGQYETAARLLLREARTRQPASDLATGMLCLGIAAMACADITVGASHGLFAMTSSAWPAVTPAVTNVGAVAMLIQLAPCYHASNHEPGTAPGTALPQESERAVRAACTDPVRDGTPLSRRPMTARSGRSRRKVGQPVPNPPHLVTTPSRQK